MMTTNDFLQFLEECFLGRVPQLPCSQVGKHDDDDNVTLLVLHKESSTTFSYNLMNSDMILSNVLLFLLKRKCGHIMSNNCD